MHSDRELFARWHVAVTLGNSSLEQTFAFQGLCMAPGMVCFRSVGLAWLALCFVPYMRVVAQDCCRPMKTLNVLLQRQQH